MKNLRDVCKGPDLNFPENISTEFDLTYENQTTQN